MNQNLFTFRVNSTNPDAPLKISAWANDVEFLAPTHVNGEIKVEFPFDDDLEKTYKIKIVLSGKTNEHTKIDGQGNIIEDTVLTFKDFELLEINLDSIVSKLAVYQHNFNGNDQEVKQNFYLSMGCNGTVEFDFTTPTYLWLLENL